MNNYIKCKYKVNFSEEVLEKVDVEWEKLTYLCEPINKKHGDFLVRRNGELCHNIVEYKEVGPDEFGKPGVIWNGTTYARVTNRDWERVDFTGELEIKTQIIAPQTDADVKIKFKVENGYVISAEPNVLLIDNTARLKHNEQIKQIAIKRAIRVNSWHFKLFRKLVINPLINICIYLRYPLIFCQEGLIHIENKLKKII